jgi:hypothetical protein
MTGMAFSFGVRAYFKESNSDRNLARLRRQLANLLGRMAGPAILDILAGILADGRVNCYIKAHWKEVAAQQHSSTAAQQHSSAAAQQHSSAAAQQRSSTAAQQHSSTAAQQHSSTAAQQHSSTAAKQQSSKAAKQQSSTAAQQQHIRR